MASCGAPRRRRRPGAGSLPFPAQHRRWRLGCLARASTRAGAPRSANRVRLAADGLRLGPSTGSDSTHELLPVIDPNPGLGRELRSNKQVGTDTHSGRAAALAMASDPGCRALSAGRLCDRAGFRTDVAAGERGADAPRTQRIADPAARTPLAQGHPSRRDPLVLVLLAAAALTIATADFTDAAVIGLVVIVNTAVAVRQEVGAEQALAALRSMATPRSGVVRDGVEQELLVEQIVPGDLVIVGEGDLVPADGLVVEAAALRLNEATLTG